jgi:soluble P-type ATPase
MIEIDIPGNRIIRLQNLLFDYNGTLAVDGSLLPNVKEMLIELSGKLNIHIVTADTFGMVKEKMSGLECTINIITAGNEQLQKLSYLQSLKAEETVCMGNGSNDVLMLEQATLGILVIGNEGAAASCFKHADIVCNNIQDALNLLLNPQRIIATLRK